MKTVIRNPFGKFDSLLRQSWQFVEEYDARAIAFTEQSERLLTGRERFLRKAPDCAQGIARYATL